MLAAGVSKSKGEARRLVEGGGMYLNNRRVAEPARRVATNEAIHGKFLVIRKGGKNYFLVKVV
jgi:tyrosyl-tRNA synthetase